MNHPGSDDASWVAPGVMASPRSIFLTDPAMAESRAHPQSGPAMASPTFSSLFDFPMAHSHPHPQSGPTMASPQEQDDLSSREHLFRSRPGLTAIIPAKNESTSLAHIVGDLHAQTLPPMEILIADATSTDGTVDLARSLGCRVIPGGLPAYGRNRGAQEAAGEWLLFVDADVRMDPTTLEQALAQAEERGLDGLSTWFLPDGGSWQVKLNHLFSAWWFFLSSAVGWSHSIGGFLLVRREMHEKLGGFDTGVLVAEDQDYVLRMARMGKYAFLRNPAVWISVRRFEKEGVWTMNFKWLGIELHRIFLGEVRKDTFRYFDPTERAP